MTFFQSIFAAGGPGAILAKLDLQLAFKLIPVKPDQWRLLGFRWQDRFYFQVALSLGSRSSPRIFNDFSDCLEALFQQRAGQDRRQYTCPHSVLSGVIGAGTMQGRGHEGREADQQPKSNTIETEVKDDGNVTELT